MMSSWSFAGEMERLGIIPSAEGLFKEIERTGRHVPRNPFNLESEGGEGGTVEAYDVSPR